jgi:hypothetical protein
LFGVASNVNARFDIPGSAIGLNVNSLEVFFIRARPAGGSTADISLFTSYYSGSISVNVTRWQNAPTQIILGASVFTTDFNADNNWAGNFYFLARYDCDFTDAEAQSYVNNFFDTVNPGIIQQSDQTIAKGIARGIERGIV